MNWMRRVYGLDVADDLWSEVVLEKGPQVYAAYDATRDVNDKGIDAYFIGSIRWYTHKYMLLKKRREKRETTVSMDLENTVDSVLVSNIMESTINSASLVILDVELTEFENWLLRAIHVEGYTAHEVAVVCGVTATTVKRWLRDTEERAREVLSR